MSFYFCYSAVSAVIIYINTVFNLFDQSSPRQFSEDSSLARISYMDIHTTQAICIAQNSLSLDIKSDSNVGQPATLALQLKANQRAALCGNEPMK